MRRDKRVPLRLREAEAGAAAVRAAPSPARRIGPWPYLWLLVMGVFWGSTFSLAKIATEGGAHPVGLSFWQGALGCGFILILCLARRRPPPLTRRHLGFYAVCGLLGCSTYFPVNQPLETWEKQGYRASRRWTGERSPERPQTTPSI